MRLNQTFASFVREQLSVNLAYGYERESLLLKIWPDTITLGHWLQKFTHLLLGYWLLHYFTFLMFSLENSCLNIQLKDDRWLCFEAGGGRCLLLDDPISKCAKNIEKTKNKTTNSAGPMFWGPRLHLFLSIFLSCFAVLLLCHNSGHNRPF